MRAVDLSFGWPDLTGAVLAERGVTHVIGYAGCYDTRKNVAQYRLADWDAAGLASALVIEDTERDDFGHYSAGQDRGRRILHAAAELGYDASQHVLFVAVDRDVTTSEEAGVADYLRGFQSVIPVPGCYGDYQTLTWAEQLGFAVLWQSDSKAYSQDRVYPGAHLLQIYNAPEVAGLEVDLDEVRIQPLRFMGEPMDGFTDADRATLARIDRNVLGVNSQLVAPSGFLARLGANLAKTAQQLQDAQHTDTAAQLAALQGALEPVFSGGLRPATPEEEHAVADFVVDEMSRRLGVAPAPPATS